MPSLFSVSSTRYCGTFVVAVADSGPRTNEATVRRLGVLRDLERNIHIQHAPQHPARVCPGSSRISHQSSMRRARRARIALFPAMLTSGLSLPGTGFCVLARFSSDSFAPRSTW